MASADIWKNAPSTIRQHDKATINQSTVSKSHTSQNQPTTPLRQPIQTQSLQTPQSENLSAHRPPNLTTRNSIPFGRHLDDNTITTAYSNTTTINSNFVAKRDRKCNKNQSIRFPTNDITIRSYGDSNSKYNEVMPRELKTYYLNAESRNE
jgi:hypothetical protein